MKNLALLLFFFTLLAGPAVADVAEGPWVITTDYGVFGGIEALDAHAPWSTSGELSSIPGDAVGRWHDGLIYVVGRGGASLVQVYDPSGGWNLVREFSVGSGRNPQDIAFDGAGAAWISCYDDTVLLKVDPNSGDILLTLDTSAFADADGFPETGWVHHHDDRLYVTCQNLDRDGGYAPTGPGRILVVDTVAGQWRDAIDLESANPYTPFREDEADRLLVGCAGYWAMNDGGIEAVDTAAGQSLGLLVDEAQLGGDVLNFVPTGGDTLLAITSSATFTTSLVRVLTGSGEVTVLMASSGYDLADLAWDGGFQLFVADRKSSAPGIRVFDSHSGAELTGNPVATTLPPFQFILAGGNGLSAPPPAGALLGRLQLGAPFPNPCNPAADLVVHDAPGSRVRVSVFDLRGHRVDEARLVCGTEGRATFRFTGRTSAGRTLAAGAYRVAAQGPGGFAARTITLVK